MSMGAWSDKISELTSDLYCEPYGNAELPSGLETSIINGMDTHSIRIIKLTRKNSEQEPTEYKVKMNKDERPHEATNSGLILKWKISDPNRDNGFINEFTLDRLSGELRELNGNLILKFKCIKKEALF